MDRITQEAYYRQRVLKYAAKHGVTKAAERYRMSRKTVHKWKRRYDGTVESLKNRSRAPLHSPLKQSDWEIQLVQRYAKKYPRDLLLGYEKAQKNGYVRSYQRQSNDHIMTCLGMQSPNQVLAKYAGVMW